jgi:selenide,water dikinase
MGLADLKQVLESFPRRVAKELLVGMETPDDAAVYELKEDLLLVQTVDFFTPIVDDPYLYGQIAAANSMSDVYAMGGKPLIALNIVCFPCGLELKILAELLRGGREKAEEAGVLIVGGHSVEDEVPKYGMSVTGIVQRENIITINKAQPNDYLVLTKPLGIGILATALKGGLISEDDMKDAIGSAAELNRGASEAAVAAGVSAGTDVTGFGLLGHLYEMMEASKCAAEIWLDQVPIWPEALRHAEMGVVPGGTRRSREALANRITVGQGIEKSWLDILLDPQTSGGLLLCVSPDGKDNLLRELSQRKVAWGALVGRVTLGEPGTIILKREA